MAPEIRIVEGPVAEANLSLTGMVCRLGSDAACDLVLPNEAPLAAVIRSKEKERLVYNRSVGKIVVGRKTVQPEQYSRWRAGQKLRMASGAVLVWSETPSTKPVAARPSSETQPSPDMQPDLADQVLDSTLDREASNATEETTGSRLRLVTGLMLLFALYLFGTDSSGTLDKSATAHHALIEELVEKSPTSDPRLQHARIFVQRGRQAELRGSSDMAQEQYVKARALLQRSRAVSDPLSNNPVVARLEKKASAFVVRQLEQLQR